MDARRLDELVAATDAWHGGVPVPEWFDPNPGETVYAVVYGTELLELRESAPPLLGGSSTVDVAIASAMTDLRPAASRSIWLQEAVPARDSGVTVVTSERVVFHGERDRSWRYAELQDITHDTAVPETWLAVRSRKRISGIRCRGAAALQLRFTLALALATVREERPVLRAWLLRQRPCPTETAPSLPASLQPPVGEREAGAGARLRRSLAVVYLGKKGVAPPLRIAQGVAAALATLLLLGTVLPDAPPREVELSAAERSAGAQPEVIAGAAAGSEREAGGDAAKAQAEEQARAAAEQDRARKAAEEAARAAAEQETARRAAEAAARVAAEQAAKKAADDAARVAAEQEAARKAAEAAAAKKAAEASAQDEAARQAAAATAPERATSSGSGCLSEYPDFCVPAGPDLDCPDVDGTNFTVREPDRFRFDADNDGVGCES
jgi:hypothetical protein